LDSNNDGIRQTSENASVGAKINVFTSTDLWVNSVITDSEGNYEINDLAPGIYYLQFGRPLAKSWTSKDQGSDDTVDSDVSTTTGRTSNFAIDYEQEITSLDAGLVDIIDNHAPNGTNNTIASWEDNSYVLADTDFGFSDASDSPPNWLRSVIITGLPSTGNLYLAGEAVSVNDEIPVEAIIDGELEYVSPSNQSGTALASFSFKVRDDGGTISGGADTDSTANTITFDIMASNDPPEGADKTITLTSDNGFVFAYADFGFSDPDDTSADTLESVIIVTLPKVGSLLVGGNAVQVGDEISADLITAGALVYVPTAGVFGHPLASFEFGLRDDGGFDDGGGMPYSETTYFISFQRTDASNHAPVNTIPSSQTTNEDTNLVFSTGNSNLISIADSYVGSSNVRVTLAVTNGTLTLSGTTGLSFTAGDGTADPDMTFTGTISAINTALAGLAYSPTANYIGAAALEILTNDLGNGGFGGQMTQDDTLNITVNSVNDAPTGVDMSVSTMEDSGHTFIAPDFGFWDENDFPSDEFYRLKILTLPGSGSLTNNNVAVSANDFVTVEDIIDGKLKFTPAANANGYAYTSFTFKVQDDGGTSNGGVDLDTTARTMTINVDSVDDAPSGANNTVTTNEDTVFTFAASDFGFTDSSDSPADSLQAVEIVTLPSVGSLTNDNIAVIAGAFISAGDIGSGKLKFTPAANANGTAYASFTFKVQDDGLTPGSGVDIDGTARTMTINVTAINDAPVNGVPISQGTDLDTNLVFSSGNGNLISIADVDAASSSVQVALTATNGTVSLSGTTGLTFSAGDGTSDATMTFTGTISAINTALAGLTFSPTASYSGAASLQIVTSDQGNTGSGGTLTDDDTVNIAVDSVNDAPVNTVPSAQTINEDNTRVFSTANSNLISIVDSDAGSFLVQVTLTATNGTVTLSGTSGLTFRTGDGTTDATMTFKGTVSNINTALAGLTFAPTANYNGSASLQILTNDLGNFGTGGALTDDDTVSITVNSVNDAPVHTVPSSQNTDDDDDLYFWAGTGNQIAITDVDAGTSDLEVTLTATHGTLTLSGTTGLTFTTGDGTADTTMTFTGTLAEINTALEVLTFSPTANYNGSASVQIETSDQGNTGSGGTLTDDDTVSITVNSVNDAPVTTVPEAQVVDEGGSLVFSTGNSNLISIADVDAASSTVQATLTANNGTLTLSGTSGLSFSFSDANGVGAGDGTSDVTMTFRGTISAINTALAGITFTPTANYDGVAWVEVETNDLGNSGSGGAATSKSGVSITVESINDAPIGSNKTVSTLEDTAYTFTLANFEFTDPNDPQANQLQAVKVVTLPSVGSLTNDSSAVSANDFISVADIIDGKFKFTPAANASGTGMQVSHSRFRMMVARATAASIWMRQRERSPSMLPPPMMHR